MSQRVCGLHFHEARKALRNLTAELRDDAVHLTEKLVGARIRRREIRCLAERLDGVLVLTSRVLGDAKADVKPARLRMALDGRDEHLRSGLERAKLHQVVPPVEQVLLGRVHARGALIRLGGGNAILRALVDIAEQVEELGRFLRAEHALDLFARQVQFPGLEKRDGQVVAVGVVGRIDRSRLFEVRDGGVEFPLLQVEARECLVRLEAVRIAAHRLQQASLDGRPAFARLGRGWLRRGSLRARW